MEAAFLNLEVSDFEGRVTDTKLVIDWFFTNNVGIGGGFANTDMRFGSLGDDPFRVEYRYGGVLLYFAGVWGK